MDSMNSSLESYLDSPICTEFGDVVFSREKAENEGSVVVIRQLHGAGNLKGHLLSDEILSTSFIKHHNEIRALCLLLFSDHTAYFVEAMSPQLHCSLEYDFGDRILQCESARSTEQTVEGVRCMLPASLKSAFSPEEMEHEHSNMWDLPDEAYEQMMDGRFIDGYFDRINGSFRHAAWVLRNGGRNAVPSWEPDPWSSGLKLPDSSDDWSTEVKTEFDALRVRSLQWNIRKSLGQAGIAVVIMGSSHTKSGAESPQLSHIHYFEDVFHEQMPERNLYVIDTIEKPWTRVKWAKGSSAD